MLTLELQRACSRALGLLSEGGPLYEALQLIVDAVSAASGSACGVRIEADNLRVVSAPARRDHLDKVTGAQEEGPLAPAPGDFSAGWRIPILSPAGGVFGSLVLFKSSGEIDDVEIDLARSCTHLIAIAVERRRFEDRLHARELELSALVGALIDGVITIDHGGIIEDFNPAAERMFGYARDEVIGRNVSILMPSPDSDRHDQYIANYRRTGHARIIGAGREVVGRRKDGSEFPLDLGVTEVWLDGARKFTGVLRDVTQRKEAEDALRASERRLATLLANLPGMAYRTASVGHDVFGYASSGSRELTGYEPEELIGEEGERFFALIHPDDVDRVRTTVREAVSAQRAYAIQYRIRSKDGVERYVWDQGRRIEPEGHLEGIILDVTDRANLEAQLRHSQKMEAVGTLAAGVAHDFNNLLMGIRGCITLALKRLKGETPARRFLDEANDAAARGTQLTRHLLAFSRRAHAERRPIFLNEVVSRTEVMLRRLISERIHLSASLAESGAPVNGDANQLEQVLVNLVVNARDAIADGGTIEIRTLETTTPTGTWVVLEVDDNGVGMDEATQARIFEPFFTTKAPDKGTGLGLSSVYGIVQEHEGNIEVESTLGRGTTIRLRIPRHEVTASVIPRPPKPPIAAERVLVVEDDHLVRRAIVHALEEAGYAVSEAAGLTPARALLANERYDLVLTDSELGDGAGRELKKAFHGPLLLMSGYPDRRADAGDLPFIAKPFADDAIVARIRDVIIGSRKRAQGGHSPR